MVRGKRSVSLNFLSVLVMLSLILLSGGEVAQAATGDGMAAQNYGNAEKAGLTAEESRMFRLINQERMAAGLTTLQLDSQLTALAKLKSRDMVSAHYFGHRSKRLGTIYQQLQEQQLDYQLVAENLANAPNGYRAHCSIMKSPTHRGNILNPAFTRIGLGIVKGGTYGSMVTQILSD